MNSVILKLIGPDKPGIVSDISGLITNNGANIEESRMIRLGSEFCIMILISISENNFNVLKKELENLSEMKFDYSKTSKISSKEQPNYFIDLYGADNEGIVNKVSDILSKNNVNILELNTDTHNAPISGTTLFHMQAKIKVEENQLEEMKKLLDDISINIGLDINISKF